MHDVECPYCGSDTDINHEDGQGYTEDELHTQHCYECDRTFGYTTAILYYYEAEKLPLCHEEIGEASHELVPHESDRTIGFLEAVKCAKCDYNRRGPWTHPEGRE